MDHYSNDKPDNTRWLSMWSEDDDAYLYESPRLDYLLTKYSIPQSSGFTLPQLVTFVHIYDGVANNDRKHNLLEEIGACKAHKVTYSDRDITLGVFKQKLYLSSQELILSACWQVRRGEDESSLMTHQRPRFISRTPLGKFHKSLREEFYGKLLLSLSDCVVFVSNNGSHELLEHILRLGKMARASLTNRAALPQCIIVTRNMHTMIQDAESCLRNRTSQCTPINKIRGYMKDVGVLLRGQPLACEGGNIPNATEALFKQFYRRQYGDFDLVNAKTKLISAIEDACEWNRLERQYPSADVPVLAFSRDVRQMISHLTTRKHGPTTLASQPLRSRKDERRIEGYKYFKHHVCWIYSIFWRQAQNLGVNDLVGQVAPILASCTLLQQARSASRSMPQTQYFQRAVYDGIMLFLERESGNHSTAWPVVTEWYKATLESVQDHLNTSWNEAVLQDARGKGGMLQQVFESHATRIDNSLPSSTITSPICHCCGIHVHKYYLPCGRRLCMHCVYNYKGSTGKDLDYCHYFPCHSCQTGRGQMYKPLEAGPRVLALQNTDDSISCYESNLKKMEILLNYGPTGKMISDNKEHYLPLIALFDLIIGEFRASQPTTRRLVDSDTLLRNRHEVSIVSFNSEPAVDKERQLMQQTQGVLGNTISGLEHASRLIERKNKNGPEFFTNYIHVRGDSSTGERDEKQSIEASEKSSREISLCRKTWTQIAREEIETLWPNDRSSDITVFLKTSTSWEELLHPHTKPVHRSIWKRLLSFHATPGWTKSHANVPAERRMLLDPKNNLKPSLYSKEGELSSVQKTQFRPKVPKEPLPTTIREYHLNLGLEEEDKYFDPNKPLAKMLLRLLALNFYFELETIELSGRFICCRGKIKCRTNSEYLLALGYCLERWAAETPYFLIRPRVNYIEDEARYHLDVNLWKKQRYFDPVGVTIKGIEMSSATSIALYLGRGQAQEISGCPRILARGLNGLHAESIDH